MNSYEVKLSPSRSFFTSTNFALITLLIGNLATIGLFMANHGSILQALWTYWLQSLIIGAVCVARILLMPGLGITLIRAALASFFIIHYGGFHLVYMIFLVVFSQAGTIEINGGMHALNLGAGPQLGAIALSGGLFAIHHLATFMSERRDIAAGLQPASSIVDVYRRPYVRIIPMHLIIIFGPVVAIWLGNNAVFIVFMALKTIADVQLFRRGTGHPALNPGLPPSPAVAPSPTGDSVSRP